MKKNSEFSLIKNIQSYIQINNRFVIKGIGDDAAVIKISEYKYMLYTCDALVEGVHFSNKYFSPYEIGRKAAVVNLSDIASMGGSPKHCLVSLFLPKNITQSYIDYIYKGLMYEFGKYPVDIIGGNISKSQVLAIDLFLIGEVSSKHILFRSGAKIGDVVMVTGRLGYAASKKYRIIPQVRVKEGKQIAKSGKATSMIDISDGLSSDIQHVCDESKVGVILFENKIPYYANLDFALNGGEDYELCFTVNKKDSKLFSFATIIGEIIPEKEGRWLIDKKGNKTKLVAEGWDHLHI